MAAKKVAGTLNLNSTFFLDQAQEIIGTHDTDSLAAINDHEMMDPTFNILIHADRCVETPCAA